MMERSFFRRMMFLVIIILTSTVFLSCTPVIRKDLMESGIRNIPFAAMTSDPDSFKGKLFILGGIIVKTKVTDEEGNRYQTQVIMTKIKAK